MTTTISRVDALDILRTDHRRILELFRDFEDADMGAKSRIADFALDELDAHASVEENIFYPLVSRKARGARELVLAGLEAHHVAKLLLTELKAMPFGETYVAKFRQLAIAVTSHIEEEEERLLPLVEKTSLDFERLGRAMSEHKQRFFGADIQASAAGMGGLFVMGLVAAAGYAMYSSYRSRE